ncbi:MAG TPA: hypothetical protein DCR14_05440 [Acidimicrobiaceae bacterium]|nr:hypothetical protein [Acidimicrobiaceae bacterium]
MALALGSLTALAAPPDSTSPETTVPDSTAPDSTAPDSTAPDSTVPDSTVPDSTPPDSTVPDSTPPDSTVPDDDPDQFELPAEPADGWPVVPIIFPVLGPVELSDDWGLCRGGEGCPRRHIGTDVLAHRLQPLVAAEAGVVSRITVEHPTGGSGLRLDGDSGWQYRYYHLNNDSPGTDDGANPPGWTFAPGIEVGARVHQGQVLGWVGDSGNSEGSVPHLHFEIRRPITREAIDPYPSLQAAIRTTGCSVARDSGLLYLSAVAEQIIDTPAGAWLLVEGSLYATNATARVVGDSGTVLPACRWDTATDLAGGVHVRPDLNPADDLDAFGVRRADPFAPVGFELVAIV